MSVYYLCDFRGHKCYFSMCLIVRNEWCYIFTFAYIYIKINFWHNFIVAYFSSNCVHASAHFFLTDYVSVEKYSKPYLQLTPTVCYAYFASIR